MAKENTCCYDGRANGIIGEKFVQKHAARVNDVTTMNVRTRLYMRIIYQIQEEEKSIPQPKAL